MNNRCLNCNKDFEKGHKNKKYCSSECASTFHRKILNYFDMSEKEFSEFKNHKFRAYADEPISITET